MPLCEGKLRIPVSAAEIANYNLRLSEKRGRYCRNGKRGEERRVSQRAAFFHRPEAR